MLQLTATRPAALCLLVCASCSSGSPAAADLQVDRVPVQWPDGPPDRPPPPVDLARDAPARLDARRPDAARPDATRPDTGKPDAGPQQGSHTPLIAGSSAGYGVVWQDQRTGVSTPTMYYQQLDAAGQLVGTNTAIAPVGTIYSMLWNGTEFVVLYAQVGHTFQTISPAGVAGTAKKLDSSMGYAQLAATPTGYGMAWADGVAIKLAQLDAAGAKVGADVVVSASGPAG